VKELACCVCGAEPKQTFVDLRSGLRALVAHDGLISMEFPHLLQLIEGRRYDTISHEHTSYVRELSTYGGPLRLLAKSLAAAGQASAVVTKVLGDISAAGLQTVPRHASFTAAVLKVKRDRLELLIEASRKGLSVAGYCAPGKANTLLNDCGTRSDLLQYTVDRNPSTHGRYLPQMHITNLRHGMDARDPAGSSAGAAVEPAQGDRRATGLHPQVGRQGHAARRAS
jgi:hypothetical protein